MNTDEEIRDWYAGQALTGILSNPGNVTRGPRAVAPDAFDYAEAMMAERKKRNTEAEINPS
jgi:hypothetical protein